MTRRLIGSVILTIAAIGLWLARAEVFDLIAMLVMAFVAFRAAIGAVVGDRRMGMLLLTASILLASMFALQLRAGALADEIAGNVAQRHACSGLADLIAEDTRWKDSHGFARLDLDFAGATRFLVFLPRRGISKGFLYSRELAPLPPCALRADSGSTSRQ